MLGNAMTDLYLECLVFVCFIFFVVLFVFDSAAVLEAHIETSRRRLKKAERDCGACGGSDGRRLMYDVQSREVEVVEGEEK